MSIYAAPLYEGTFYVGLDKKFVPMDRKGKPPKNTLRVAIQPFLIHAEDKKILLDTGLGEFGQGTSIDTIHENLAEHGLSEYDITDIFLSHLHFDHTGGLAHRKHGYWELTFPDANVWLSENAWKQVLAKDNYYDDEKTEFRDFIEARADLHLLKDEDQPYPEIRVQKIGGHSQYHMAIFYEKEDHRYLMAGDVIPTKGHINQKFAAKYDFDPKQSIQARQELAQKALKEDWVLLAYHSTETAMFRLTGYEERHGYTIESVTEYVPS